ncbi:hypothetical protein EHQ64_13850 [Leptospira sarikeiensis]|uniref:Antitoxin n=1 Tax=Leptospira sarikeiensis TaxID=2484943 RepID=A0A4R9K5R0_9LEPT|nr:hypothetical protein EHQ64_13850 [Leptospira sarikeiensis]
MDLDRFHPSKLSENRYKRFTQTLQSPEKDYPGRILMTTSKQKEVVLLAIADWEAIFSDLL